MKPTNRITLLATAAGILAAIGCAAPDGQNPQKHSNWLLFDSKKKTADLREERPAVLKSTHRTEKPSAQLRCRAHPEHFASVSLSTKKLSAALAGESPGFRVILRPGLPVPKSGRWHSPTVVTGHSGGSATDLHRLPFRLA